MRLRHVTGAEETIAQHPDVLDAEHAPAGSWAEHFGNDHPICLEIGMGKGRFVLENAKRYPENNYIGIEKYATILLKSLKLAETEYAESRGNVQFLWTNAERLGEIFAPDEVDRIYLNFSDPWPKERYAKRRLTSRQFLKRYEGILKDGGLLEFKTDNRALFDFSLEEIREASAWELLAVTTDLHKDPVLSEGNIMTEYEQKFSAQGNPICKLIAAYTKKAEK